MCILVVSAVTGNKWGSTCSDTITSTDNTLTCTDAVYVCAADKKVDLATGLCSGKECFGH